MKLSKCTAAGLGAAALALLSGAAAPAAQAQVSDNVVFAAAGSSALFNVFNQAAKSVVATSGSPNSITVNGGAFVVDHVDANGPAGSNEKGNIFIVWNSLPGDSNGSPSGTRNIYFYLAVDSTVGDRAFFKRDTALLGSSSSFPGVPTDVYNAVNGATFNTAATDIRPEDALVATQRAYGFGYSTLNPIKDGAGQQATPVAFAISARSNVTTSVGASPIVVFVNKSTTYGTTPARLANVSDVSSTILSKTLDGTLASNTRFLTATGTGLNLTLATSFSPLSVFIREPLSGTYNTMEFCEPHSQQFNTTQELNVDSTPNSAGGSQNPLNDPGLALSASPADMVNDGGASQNGGGGRVRAIGTGALVRGVNSTANAIGYAFYSVGNFSSAGNSKYITVDGVDPLVTSYTDGSFPASGAANFAHVADGTYRIWSVLRVVTENPEPPAIASLVGNAVSQNGGGDFIAPSNLKVFRSHRAVAVSATGPDGGKISGVVPQPSNGRNGEPTEAGSDVGGTIYSDQLETANGAQLTNTRL